MRHVHARYLVTHVLGHARRLERPDTGQQVHPLVQSEPADVLHELGEPLDVVDQLGLDEIRTRLNLLAQPVWTPLEWIPERVSGGANEKARLRPLCLLAPLKRLSCPPPP